MPPASALAPMVIWMLIVYPPPLPVHFSPSSFSGLPRLRCPGTFSWELVAFFILFSDGVHPLLSMPMPSLGCQSSGDLAIGGGMECVRDW